MTCMIKSETTKNIKNYEDKSLLIVDDDNPFRERLARAMEKKGFVVTQAESVKKGIDSLKLTKTFFIKFFWGHMQCKNLKQLMRL